MSPSPILLFSLVAAFAISLVAAGHGVAPIGLILFLGWGRDSPWLAANLLSSSGLVLLLASSLTRRVAIKSLARLGGGLLGSAWLLFLWQAEARVVNLVTSLPFLALLAVWFTRAAGYTNARRAG